MSGAQERAVLYQLQQLRETLIAIDRDMETDEDLLLSTIDGETDAADMLRQAVRAALETESTADAVRQRETVLAARRHRLESRARACRAFVREAMQTLGLRKLPAPDFNASIRDGKPAVQITDENALPDDFVRIVRQPDKTKIGEALRSGAEIEGAVLGNATAILTVRVG